GLAGMFEKRRSLQPSKYSTLPGVHNGLGLEVYSQATSPLRRYLDLVVHQQLRAFYQGKPLLNEQQMIERIGSAIAGGRSVRKAEQLSRQHWTLVYLLQHPQWDGNGIVVEKYNGRVRLLIPELDLETSIYLRQDMELNSVVPLSFSGADLPSLEAFLQNR
ncbi:MAG: RNB domain-containing ribonuclease, partial [Anaerolineales bacterium]|nr:RNB domain-containing ribonuclease [Anaerolineales bacterium]